MQYSTRIEPGTCTRIEPGTCTVQNTLRWLRLRPGTWWFVNPREECHVLPGNWLPRCKRYFSWESTNHHVHGLSPNHWFCLHFNCTVKLQLKSKLAMSETIAYWTGPNRWVPLMGPVQQRRLNNWQQQNYVLTLWISCFLHSLINSCSVKRSTPNCLHSLYCLFLCFFSSYLCSQLLLGLMVTVVNEILICMDVTQRQLLLVAQDTY